MFLENRVRGGLPVLFQIGGGDNAHCIIIHPLGFSSLPTPLLFNERKRPDPIKGI